MHNSIQIHKPYWAAGFVVGPFTSFENAPGLIRKDINFATLKTILKESKTRRRTAGFFGKKLFRKNPYLKNLIETALAIMQELIYSLQEIGNLQTMRS